MEEKHDDTGEGGGRGQGEPEIKSMESVTDDKGNRKLMIH